MNTDPDQSTRVARRRRHLLYLVGSAVAAAGITMGTMPLFAEVTPIVVAKGVALVGAAILATGRFAPDHVLQRLLPRQR